MATTDSDNLRYTPRHIGEQEEVTSGYLLQELLRISQVINLILEGNHEILHREPDNPAVGMTVFADGTNWNPGYGAGVYECIALGSPNTWEKLGISQDIWHEVGAAGEPVFQNSWTNYGAGHETAGFYKDVKGFVHLKGLVKNGTVGLVCFTLPVGYRPANKTIYAGYSNTGVSRVDVEPSGNVVVLHGGNAYSSLDGFYFKAV